MTGLRPRSDGCLFRRMLASQTLRCAALSCPGSAKSLLLRPATSTGHYLTDRSPIVVQITQSNDVTCAYSHLGFQFPTLPRKWFGRLIVLGIVLKSPNLRCTSWCRSPARDAILRKPSSRPGLPVFQQERQNTVWVSTHSNPLSRQLMVHRNKTPSSR